MSFGFPAHFTETRCFPIQRHEFVQIVSEILESLEWDFTEISVEEFYATNEINALSWGEKININLLQNGMISVKSKCVYPLQLFDWGKNKRNVQIIFAKINLASKKIRSFEDQNGIGSAFDKNGFSRVERILNQTEK